PAFRHAFARTLRTMEGYRNHLRSSRHDPRVRKLRVRTTMMQTVPEGLRSAPITRRRLLTTAAAGLGACLLQRRAGAVLRLDVTQGNVQPMPIAVPDFLGSDPSVAHGVREIIASNLQRSGLFAPID